jgi:hypothetical protein
MKKMMMALALFLTTLTGSAFANTTEVNPKVIKAFNSDFVSAAEVNWTAGEGFYKASFTLNSKYVFAYYSADGNFLGLTRYMATSELPMMLQTSIKKNYAEYWVSDLFEVARNDGSAYYLTVEDAENVLILKSTSGNDWTVFKKNKKQ